MKKYIKTSESIDFQTNIGDTFISDDGESEVTYLGTYEVQTEYGTYEFLSGVTQDENYIRDVHGYYYGQEEFDPEDCYVDFINYEGEELYIDRFMTVPFSDADDVIFTAPKGHKVLLKYWDEQNYGRPLLYLNLIYDGTQAELYEVR